jgi:hypothetical protein
LVAARCAEGEEGDLDLGLREGVRSLLHGVHGCASNLAGGSHVGDWNYLMALAVAIWVEETVLKLAVMCCIRQVLGDGLARAIGYVWTGAFILYSFML